MQEEALTQDGVKEQTQVVVFHRKARRKEYAVSLSYDSSAEINLNLLAVACRQGLLEEHC